MHPSTRMNSYQIMLRISSLLAIGALVISCDSTSSGGGEAVAPPSSWNSSITYGSVTDSRDGHAYRTVNIGGQEWMAENLNFPSITDANGSWCYDGSTDNCTKYGRLYNWAAAMAISDAYNTESFGILAGRARGVCPSGWHLPSKSEWQSMLTAAGTASMVGANLKAATGWPTPGEGLDTYGFRILPAGNRSETGDFQNIDYSAHLWTASEYLSNQAASVSFYFSDSGSTSRNDHKKVGYSVRCTRD